MSEVDWKNRIGADPWKNLLAEECAVLNESTDPEAPRSFEPGPLTPARHEDVLCWRRLSGSTPWDSSFLVFLAGRYILVGASSQAVERLRQADIEPLSHVILLTWHPSHVGGLLDLLATRAGQAFQGRRTIWTSSWIWEEVQHEMQARSVDVRQHFLDFSQNALQLSPADAARAFADGGPPAWNRNAIVTFERETEISLTLGVKVKLDHVLQKLPSLRVTATCNAARIVIDPLGAVRTAEQMDHLRSKLVGRLESMPSLHREAFYRYGEDLDRSEPPRIDGDQWESVVHPTGMAGESPIFVGMSGSRLSEIEFVAASGSDAPRTTVATLQPIPEAGDFASPNLAAHVLRRTAVMILCGGLSAKAQRALLDPGRDLSVPGIGAHLHVFSILAWRLSQLQAWAAMHQIEAMPVLLMTSPDTEGVVEREVRRFNQRLERSREKIHVEVNLLPQRLVPLLNERNGELSPIMASDGGWQVEAAGHLDAVRLLVRWNAVHPEYELAFVFAHNNLGALVNPRTIAALERLDRSGASAAAELFNLDFQLSADDDRWDHLSYLNLDGVRRLVKKQYRSATSLQTPEHGRLFSSLTWYFDLRKLPEALDRPPLKQIIIGPGRDSLHPRQDLEMLTHVDGLEMLFLEETQAGDGAPGPFKHSRFLAVRTEDQIRSKEFRDAFDRAVKLQIPASPELPLDAAIPDIPFIELTPSVKDYIWGGNEIAKAKGMPEYWQHRIAETWEVSTHPSGPSTFYLNLHHPVPLAELLRHALPDRSTLPFMVKYLDCHEPLSIQVHPNQTTAGWLAAQRKPRLFNLQDESGKDESFYVLRTAPRVEFNLLLGFARASLEPIARRLWPILDEYASRQEIDLTHCFDKVVQEARAQLYREFVGPIVQRFPDADDRELLRASVLKSFVSASQLEGKDRLRNLQRVFAFHVSDHPILIQTVPPPHSLRGKEYLFAAICLIRAIEELVRAAQSSSASRRFRDVVKDILTVGDRQRLQESPVLRFFHTESIEPGWWGRVPAGTVHSWQGGGNFIVEIGQQSDNTFRIVDFGREIEPATRRDMHYLEAMYALGEDTIVAEHPRERLMFEATAAQSWRKCHAELNYQLLRSTDPSGWVDVPACTPGTDPTSLVVLMNPDNVVRIKASDAGAIVRDRRIGPASAVVVTHAGRVEALPAHSADTLLVLAPREKFGDLLCVSLGTTKVEIALWRDTASPPIVWGHTAWLEGGARLTLEHARATFPFLQGLGGSPRLPRLALAWPGPIGGATLHTSVSQLENQDRIADEVADVLSGLIDMDRVPVPMTDAAVAVLGEHRHSLGSLPGPEPGMLLNIGSGVCAGFYPAPEPRHARLLAACGAVGRWLYVDPLSGKIEPPPDPAAVETRVFAPPVDIRTDKVRASIYMSSAGVALRLLSQLEKKDAIIAEAGWSMPRPAGNRLTAFVQAVKTVTRDPQAYSRQRFFRAVDQCRDPETARAIRNIIIVTGGEIASMILNIRSLLKAAGLPDYTRRVVLAGALGERFGRLAASGSSADLLVDTINNCLGSPTVKRSEISVSCFREAEGFVHHLEGMER